MVSIGDDPYQFLSALVGKDRYWIEGGGRNPNGDDDRSSLAPGYEANMR